MREVLLVTGGLGAGKTSVAVKVGELLAARGTPSSVIDLDQLCWTTPDAASGFDVTDVLASSLRALLPVHQAAGVHRFVLPRLLRDADDVESVAGAVAPARVVVVLLTADARERERRLVRRDSASTVQGHLDEVELLLPDPAIADIVVATDGRTVAEVAAEVLSRWDAAAS
jgi:hypothetical protein